MAGPQKLSDFGDNVLQRRPPGPSPPGGYLLSPTRGSDGDVDEAHYILKPDVEFNRPWLGSPQGNSGVAFVWPIGIEGFTITSNAETGIHKYLGDNDIDVDVVFPDEEHIMLSGSFPGDKSVANMGLLKNVILHKSDQSGKILGLPGIESQILYVAVLNRQFIHNEGDFSKIISYSVEFIRVGVGGKLSSTVTQTPTPNPPIRTKPRGKGKKRTTVKHHRQTLRGMAEKVYGSPSGDSIKRLQVKNVNLLEEAGIPSYKQSYAKIPPGLKLDF